MLKIPVYIWLSLLVLLIVLTIVAYLTWFERKVAGRIQRRIGPYWVGRPHGWLQPLADAIKILRKEDIVPENADKLVFNTAPFIFMILPLMTFAVFPITKVLVYSDINVGILYVLAFSSLSIIAVLMAGWGSNNKYAMLSAMRFASQLISYEVPLILAILVPVLLSQSLKLSSIVTAQKKLWFIFWPVVGQVSFILFVLASLAETNRIPFDIPEAESELVAGFTIEYSGWKFAMFYVAEYAHMLIIAVLGAILFLGGWQGPVLPGIIWFSGKVLFMLLILLWIRWSFLRLRVDQFLKFNWKYLVPIGILNLLIASIFVAMGF